jgi:hypothetical protein
MANTLPAHARDHVPATRHVIHSRPLRILAKLGFKTPKTIVAMDVTDKWTGGYWENQGYNWFSGS